MAASREIVLEQKLLLTKEVEIKTTQSTTPRIVSCENYVSEKNINVIISDNVSNKCRCPFNKHDRPLAYIAIGLVLLFSGFILLKHSKRMIKPIK